jgi:hypothetical protein
MKPIDFTKALVLAAMIMAVEFLLSYPLVTIYSLFIAPGHTNAFYTAAAERWIVPWWIHIGGSALFFFAGWLFTGRARGRNAYAFVATTCGWYLLIELASFAYLGGLSVFIRSGAAVWLAVQFAAAFAGAFVANRSGVKFEQPSA